MKATQVTCECGAVYERTEEKVTFRDAIPLNACAAARHSTAGVALGFECSDLSRIRENRSDTIYVPYRSATFSSCWRCR
jgi:hypothetical protein